MGKTKIKTIDDSAPEEVKKPAKKLGRSDDALVEKLKEELGIKEKSERKQTEEVKHLGGEAKPEPSTHLRGEAKAKPRSKKYQEAVKDLDKSKFYPLPEALDIVKKTSYTKFNGPGTLEAHINTTQMGIRGLISLPFASGKKLRILVFGKGADKSGATIFGDDSTLDTIATGKIDFDLIITTPEWMSKLAKVAKILGPRGLMPSPKNGTITDDLKKAVESFQAGKTEYKTESKAKVIHLGLGKLNQPNEELSANIKMLLQTLGKTRIQKLTLSPTMGAGVKVDLASI